MKKLFFIAAIASAALVSCVKNEVIPVNDGQQEITYMTSPVTKVSEMATSSRFRSWAYHHQEDWNTSLSPQLYLGGDSGLEIQNISNVWKNDTQSYYWPKTGKLTFYAYSLNSATTFLTDCSVTCTSAEGIRANDYDIVKNKDIDFMVADQAKDQEGNNSTDQMYKDGVKTLFRHKLTNVIFKIQSTEDYAGKTFRMNSITLNNVVAQADYVQNPATTDVWMVDSYTNIVFSNEGVNFSKTSPATPVAAQSYYIPQVFTDAATVTLNYTVTTQNGTATPATETVEVTKKLSEIFTAGWGIGVKTTCTITVSLKEIYWDPAVETWSENTGSWSIN